MFHNSIASLLREKTHIHLLSELLLPYLTIISISITLYSFLPLSSPYSFLLTFLISFCFTILQLFFSVRKLIYISHLNSFFIHSYFYFCYSLFFPFFFFTLLFSLDIPHCFSLQFFMFHNSTAILLSEEIHTYR